MPPVNQPQSGDQFMALVLLNIQQRLSALEFAANTGIVDGRGVLRERVGLLPDGTYGIEFYNEDGQLVMRLGEQGDDTYGAWIFDPSGNPQVALGDLGGGATAGPYGVAVLPAGATYVDHTSLQRVGGATAGAACSASSSTATTFTAFTGPNGLVSVPIGPSGKAIVTLIGTIATGGSGNEGFLGVSVDGAAPGAPFIDATGSGSGFSGLKVSGNASVVLAGLSQATHTFAPQFKMANTGTVGFTQVIVTVQPL